MCSITHAIDNPFDESLAANKGDGRREREKEIVVFSRVHATPFHERQGYCRFHVPRSDTISFNVTHPPIGVVTEHHDMMSDVRKSNP